MDNFQISNRKILAGYFRGLGIDDPVSAIRIVDKLDKIGEEGVLSQLQSSLNLPRALALRCLALAKIRTTGLSFVDQVQALGVESNLLDKGLEELAFVIDALSSLPGGTILADLSIARGFDYYTGTVYECKLLEFPSYPSICAGGRYDNLAGAFIKRKLPGVFVPLQVEHIVCLRVPFFPPSAVISLRVYRRAVAIIHQGEASWRHFCDAGEARMVNHVLNIVISRMCGYRAPFQQVVRIS